MCKERRVQFRLSLSPSMGKAFDTAKQQAESAANLELTDAAFALNLLRRALEDRVGRFD